MHEGIKVTGAFAEDETLTERVKAHVRAIGQVIVIAIVGHTTNPEFKCVPQVIKDPVFLDVGQHVDADGEKCKVVSERTTSVRPQGAVIGRKPNARVHGAEQSS